MGAEDESCAAAGEAPAVPAAWRRSPRLVSLAPLLASDLRGGAGEAPGGGRTSVLLVEDNPADAGLIRRALPPSTFDLAHVTSLADAICRLEAGNVDIVLLDLSLPDGQGAESIAWTLAAAPGVPIVVLTGLANDAVALRAVRAGVQDYLVKDALDGELLPRTIRYAIERERLTAELDAVRRRQLETKDQLLSNVSHELRTPLNVVYQFVMLLLDEIGGPLTADQREYLDIARRNVDQLRTMIGDLLDATRLEGDTLKVEPVATSLSEVAEETLRALAAEAVGRGVALHHAIPDDGLLLRADPLRLRQVLTNVVHNAITFTPRGGRVTVSAAPDEALPEHVRIRVTDTGPGIRPEAVSQIFERLHQDGARPTDASRKGLGLGLYISRELIRRQRGRIWVEGTSSRGTTLAIVLPLWTGRDDVPGRSGDAGADPMPASSDR